MCRQGSGVWWLKVNISEGFGLCKCCGANLNRGTLRNDDISALGAAALWRRADAGRALPGDPLLGGHFFKTGV